MEKANEYMTRMDDLIPLFRERLEAGQKVRFSPRGISMLPMLRQGRDCVILSPVPEKLKKYDLPLYRRDDGKYVLHRVVKVDETYTCIGDNQFVYEPDLRHDQMIAVVSAFCRDEKQYSISHMGYRIYCRLWYYSRPVRHFCHRAIGWIRRHLT